MAEKISKQPSIDSVVWLLVLTLMKIYNEKEQAEQIKMHNVQSEDRNTRKWNGAKFCVQGDKQMKN